MDRAGFVLVGGQSSRMGRDKALLPYGGGTLAAHVASTVRQAAGSVVLVGDPVRYGRLGYPVIPDLVVGCGPLGGIEAALASTTAEWSLIVACDMPALSSGFLERLFSAAESSDGDCLLPVSPPGLPQPLCAVYRKRCLPAISEAVRDGRRKITEALEGLQAAYLPVSEAACFENINTPEDWAARRVPASVLKNGD